MKLTVIEPYGSCQGVRNAKARIECLEGFPRPFYLTDLPVHDPAYGARLFARGFLMLPPDDHTLSKGTLIISAHGFAKPHKERLSKQGLKVLDLTCPFVEALHIRAREALHADKKVFFLGRAESKETKELIAEGDITLITPGTKITSPDHAYVLSQTTLETKWLDDIITNSSSEIHPGLCKECSLRQTRLKKELPHADGIVIVGSVTSANARSLKEIASTKPVILTESLEKILSFCEGKDDIILASATSADDVKAKHIKDCLIEKAGL